MRMFLQHDAGSGQLRLVMADYYHGAHERTAYTVVNDADEPIRGCAHLDGATVQGSAATGFYVYQRGARFTVRTMPGERSVTERTPCPRYLGRARKCTMCAADGALIP